MAARGTPPLVVVGRSEARFRTGEAIGMSFRRFNPRALARNPVMFVVFVFAIFLALVTAFPQLFPDLTSAHFSRSYYLAVAFVLFLTVWFSNLAESIAEAQGKALAASLREIRGTGRAVRVLADNRRELVPFPELRRGDTVALGPGELVPLDGDIIQGGAEVDESMMTGESGAVVRESGGDRTSVLGGSRVLRGSILVRLTSSPGQSFLDRMISLVEGARRDRTPNELALTLVLSAFTMSLLVVIFSFEFSIRAAGGHLYLDVATAVALLVCLAPTTIGGLLPAIGIAGVNRVARINVIAKSGRAVESSGDLDVLILDKTGTITVGNRLAVDFVSPSGGDRRELSRVAAVASLQDDTPEGRSILRLAVQRGIRREDLTPAVVRGIPFSAEKRVSGVVVEGGAEVIKGALSSVRPATDGISAELEAAANEASAKGMTPLAVAYGRKVLGLVLLKDVVKPGLPDRLHELRTMGIRTVMCTGDNRITASAIAKESGVDDFVAEARPETKLELVDREKRAGRLVAMTGDGVNDAPALARADVGLAMNNGTSAAKEAGNMVDLDSDPTKIIELVSLGKQLLITRGALTTFSITNDVAKYFAILPAIFVGVAGVELLNVLHLTNPHLAVLATLLFNAIVIPLMVPFAIRGAPFRPRTAVELLRSNMLIWGLGGFVFAFAGIELIYLGLNALARQPYFLLLLHWIVHMLGS
jgi:K+-transporting ATPase ATPase B chain